MVRVYNIFQRLIVSDPCDILCKQSAPSPMKRSCVLTQASDGMNLRMMDFLLAKYEAGPEVCRSPSSVGIYFYRIRIMQQIIA